MPNKPTKQEIQLWIPAATEIFKSIMPPIHIAYPSAYIADGRNFRTVRERLVSELECMQTKSKENNVMEYIHGEKGCAILIRKDLLPSRLEKAFRLLYWHELGHFYAINSETLSLYSRFSIGLNDDSRILEFAADGADGASVPVMGLSDERIRQEGYWVWQEFIAETISKYVNSRHRSSAAGSQTDQSERQPRYFRPIDDWLKNLLEETLWYYPTTIDEYALAHYFANLLMDEKSNPDCISEPDDERIKAPLRMMRGILEKQLAKERFWEIDESFLLKTGRCVSDLWFAKLLLMAGNATVDNL